MQCYIAGEKVLANCGTKQEPDWIPGTVITRLIDPIPCQVLLDREVRGTSIWYLPDSYLVQDTRRNRRKKGVDYETKGASEG